MSYTIMHKTTALLHYQKLFNSYCPFSEIQTYKIPLSNNLKKCQVKFKANISESKVLNFDFNKNKLKI